MQDFCRILTSTKKCFTYKAAPYNQKAVTLYLCAERVREVIQSTTAPLHAHDTFATIHPDLKREFSTGFSRIEQSLRENELPPIDVMLNRKEQALAALRNAHAEDLNEAVANDSDLPFSAALTQAADSEQSEQKVRALAALKRIDEGKDNLYRLVLDARENDFTKVLAKTGNNDYDKAYAYFFVQLIQLREKLKAEAPHSWFFKTRKLKKAEALDKLLLLAAAAPPRSLNNLLGIVQREHPVATRGFFSSRVRDLFESAPKTDVAFKKTPPPENTFLTVIEGLFRLLPRVNSEARDIPTEDPRRGLLPRR